jgi:FkbH-like protein
MVLKLDDISCFIANWDDKHKNLREIAHSLNISLNSIVFFDDNPVEREMVSETLPEVNVVDVPEDPAYFVRALELEMHFDWIQLSTEDITRSSSIIANEKRKSLEKVSHNYDDYLKNLKMSAKIGEVSGIEFPRFVQLINKTNQFNLRTKRYTTAEVEVMRKEKNYYKLIFISLKDKFCDYGIISGLIIKRINNKVFIDTWVVSCRVFSRNIEQATFNSIIETVKNWGCIEIIGEYSPTKKNIIVRKLYPDLGFKISDEGNDNSIEKYHLMISDAQKLNNNIKIDY